MMHSENSEACFARTPFVSEPNRHLTDERGTVNTAQIQLDCCGGRI